MRVIKDIAANLAFINLKRLQYIYNYITKLLTTILSSKLQQAYKQILDITRGIYKVGYNTKKPIIATFSSLTIKAYIDFTNSIRQSLYNLQLYKTINFYYKP